MSCRELGHPGSNRQLEEFSSYISLWLLVKRPLHSLKLIFNECRIWRDFVRKTGKVDLEQIHLT